MADAAVTIERGANDGHSRRGTSDNAPYPYRLANGGHSRRGTVRERLLTRVEVDADGCWLWPKLANGGYPTTSANGRSWLVHRLSYTEFVGPIPEGAQVHHVCHEGAPCSVRGYGSCKHQRCINPAHLEALSLVEHTRRHHPIRARATCYTEGCDHEECRTERQRLARFRRRLLNRPDTVSPAATVPAGVVRSHIAELRAKGLGLGIIADRSGLSEFHLRRIVNGETKRVTPSTKDRILGVLPTGPAPGAFVDATLTLGRLADLYAAGYSRRDVARESGVPFSTIRCITADRRTVRARTADSIADLHDVAGLDAYERDRDVDPLAEWRMLLSDIGDQAWREDAECRRLDATNVKARTDLFFPERGGDLDTPREVCARCPVSAECEDFAVVTRTQIGVWGGRSGKDLREIRHEEVVAAREERAS